MGLTIEQVLQQGIAAHNAGNLQEAGRAYRAVLQSYPQQPDANHNLGLLAISANQIKTALPLFKTALDVNPNVEQFWMSYIDALIKNKQLQEAKRAIRKAKKRRFDADKLQALLSQSEGVAVTKLPSQEQLSGLLECYQDGRYDEAEKLAGSITQDFPEHQFAWKVLGAVLGAKGKKSEAIVAAQAAVALAPQDAEAHSNLGVMLQEIGSVTEAECSLRQAIALKPDFTEAHNNLGNTLKELGRLDEALASYNQAIALKPDYAKAHSNLSGALKVLGRLDEAEESSRQAIALKPDLAEAHYNLGRTLKGLGRLDEAIVSYKQAIALKPDLAEAHNNLGITFKVLGRLDEALASYYQAIALKPNYAEAYVNLGSATKDVTFNSPNRKLYPSLTKLLTAGNFTRPIDVADCILSLLKHDARIKDLLLKDSCTVSLDETIAVIKTLDKFPLLHHLMRVCPLPDLQFEELFVAIRNRLLKNLDEADESPELIYFLSTLSIHCFTNEYIYSESDEESNLVDELQTKVFQIVTQSKQPELIEILCLASYRPLHKYDWCQTLEFLDNQEEVKKRLIEEPLLEKKIAKDIPQLEEISDIVSSKVRDQYEENPYPRWVKLHVPLKAKPIAAICDELKLQLHSETIKSVSAPFILIAGCGTGQHSIGTASRFSNCHVTAVDLSLASLAYAKRKTEELGLGNLEYLQADILHLHQMGKEFDIIESAGVLHHMADPMDGWSVLVNLLKPGGLMKIGLYSELARQDIAEVRKEIASLGLGTSATEIRNFRELLRESEIHDVKILSTFSDYFSFSEFRDLVFHLQEHRFTLPQIKNCLDELGLKFCGFEDIDLVSNFRELHGNEADILDFELWHQYEERNPRAFPGMYQFWCQKMPC